MSPAGPSEKINLESELFPKVPAMSTEESKPEFQGGSFGVLAADVVHDLLTDAIKEALPTVVIESLRQVLASTEREELCHSFPAVVAHHVSACTRTRKTIVFCVRLKVLSLSLSLPVDQTLRLDREIRNQ